MVEVRGIKNLEINPKHKVGGVHLMPRGKATIRDILGSVLFGLPLSLAQRGSMKGDSVANERVTLDELKKKMADLAKERDWDQFHSPRNLLLALVVEVGKLSEIFQWKGEVPRGLPDWEEGEKLHLGEKLSDVLLYLVRLSDVCGIDLDKAALRKSELNALKYPTKLCKGSQEAYNDIHKGNNRNAKTNLGSL